MFYKRRLDFYNELGEILFIDFIKQNYRYENNLKTDELDSFSIRCFSLNQKDTFILKVLDLSLLKEVMELDTFQRIDVGNGEITEYKNKYFFKCQNFIVISNE